MFFGWRVVAGSFVCMMLVLGFFSYTFSLFVVPLREEFGVGLEQVMYSLTLGTLLSLLVGPIAGYLIDHLSVRLLMTLGMLLFAASLFTMSRTATITQFNLVFGFSFALVTGMAGPVATSAAVSRWFVRSRGRALGIMTIGSSAGGMLLPAIAAGWINSVGWRAAIVNLGLMALLAIPWVWLNIRSRQGELGMEPDGDLPAAAAVDGAAAEKLAVQSAALEADSAARAVDAAPLQPAAPGMAKILRSGDFWLIGFSVGLLVAVFSATLSNLSPYATGLGASNAEASTLIMVLAIHGLIGKLLFGAGADRFPLKWGMWAAQGLLVMALLIFSAEPPYYLMMAGAVCMGLATGGLLPVWNSMTAQVFGVDSYGRAMGLMGPVITLLVMPAYLFVGRMHDALGNYVLTLWVFVALMVLAILLLIPLHLPRHGAGNAD